ncbi:MAG: PDZ domain-containing protein [Phycisphaerales bacterium]|nr:PDZ domain-containing protein [Phycisphaerales bacterium]
MMRKWMSAALACSVALAASPAWAILVLKADDPVAVRPAAGGESGGVIVVRGDDAEGGARVFAIASTGDGAVDAEGGEVRTFQTADGNTVIVRTSGGGAAAGAFSLPGNDPNGKRVMVRLSGGPGGEVGAPYIGVLLAPVSEALAAHVGEGGLIISNLVAGSPAEGAGLRRYDIIRGVNGEALKDVSAVTDAVKQAGVGGRVELRVLRAGSEMTIALSPQPRPAEPARYVHEMDDGAGVEARPMFRGHQIRVAPDGKIEWESLGQLRDATALRPLVELHGLGDTSQLLARLESLIADGEAGATVEVSASHDFAINVVRNGESLSVRSGEDGRIVVERVAADGTKTVTEYDDAARLREADAEAYEVAKDAIEPAGGASGPGGLSDRRLEWQAAVERHLKEVLSQRNSVLQDWQAIEREMAGMPAMREAVERIRARMGDATERLAAARELLERTREVQIEASSDGTRRESVFDATVHADGRVTILSRSADGEVREEFASEDDLKSKDPVLYERFMQRRAKR